MLLLISRGPVQRPSLRPLSSQAICVDDEYAATLGESSQPILCVEDAAQRLLRQQAIVGPALRLGRGPDNDLVLNYERIQPRHLVMLRLPTGVFFVVTSPDAEVLGPQGPVSTGWWTPDLRLKAGAFRLRVQGVPSAVPDYDPLAVSPDLTAELPQLELKFLGSTVPKRPWRITRPLTLIGRSPLCRIRLDHERMLPVQAALVRTPGRLWLVNFGPASQLRVNDDAVSSASLEVGDLIRLGDFRMEIQSAAAGPEATKGIGAAPQASESPPTAELEALVRQFAEQQQKIIESQRVAIAQLSQLAAGTTDPAQLRAVLEQIETAYTAIGQDHSQIQAQLQSQLKTSDS